MERTRTNVGIIANVMTYNALTLTHTYEYMIFYESTEGAENILRYFCACPFLSQSR